MKKVLVVAYHYPPSPAVGANRPAKFVRYLPEFGWHPLVLTIAAQTDGICHNDGCEIYRVREWPHPMKLYERYKEQRARRAGRNLEYGTNGLSYAAAMAPG